MGEQINQQNIDAVLLSAIRSSLEGVHIETGRRDDFDSVCEDIKTELLLKFRITTK